MTETKGKILKVHPPKWTYKIFAQWSRDENGKLTVRLEYADGTPFSKEDTLNFLIENGFIEP